jgi:hypothetical protein
VLEDGWKRCAGEEEGDRCGRSGPYTTGEDVRRTVDGPASTGKG